MVASLALLSFKDERRAERAGELDAQKFADLIADMDTEDRLEALRWRFRWNQDEFARYCWPEHFDLPFTECHDALLSRPRHYKDRPTTRNAVAAPRGIGKSAIASYVDVIHRIVYGLERFVILVSAEERLAINLTKDIRDTFLNVEEGGRGERIRELFGVVDVAGGKSEYSVSVNGARRIGVLARSFGQQIRGAKYNGERPTLIVIDDGERSDKVRSKSQRRNWWQFLVDDIAKAGRKQGGTEIKVRGTVLHVDGMLATCLRDDGPGAGWDSQRFASIISWPDREDLWRRCGDIWKNIALGEHRMTAAYAFYQSNREAMDAGVEVLDPVAEPIFTLYETIWAEGLASFLREKQNQPRHGSAQMFDSSKFVRFRVSEGVIISGDRRVLLSDCRITAYLDPIPGEDMGDLSDDGGSGGGDSAAVAVIARDSFGYAYVLQIWLKRAKDSVILASLWALCEQWRVRKVGIESNGFARFFGRDFRRQQKERRKADEESRREGGPGVFWQLNIEEQSATENKNDRIASLEPSATNGWLQFNETVPTPALQQFDDAPNGSHDDAPDATEGAWTMSGGFDPPRMSMERMHL